MEDLTTNRLNFTNTFSNPFSCLEEGTCRTRITSVFEAFKGCGYRKTTNTCHEPAFGRTCPLPAFDMKRGALNQMVFSLYFFLRDVCRRDFYTYVREHFGDCQQTDKAMSELLQNFIGKITTIANVSPKLAHMALAWLFLTRSPVGTTARSGSR